MLHDKKENISNEIHKLTNIYQDGDEQIQKLIDEIDHSIAQLKEYLN